MTPCSTPYAMTKKPPVSLRVPDATRIGVEAWAKSRGVTRNAAYVELLARGLNGATKGAKEVERANRAMDAAEARGLHADVQIGPSEPKPGSRLKVKK